jgi:hypothetical protein
VPGSISYLEKVGHQWRTPVILATRKAESKEIEVRSQPRQIVHETLSQNYPTQKRAGGVAQMVEPHIASMRPQYNNNKKVI